MRYSPIIALFLFCNTMNAQSFQANYDESKVPDFVLPDPLIIESGEQVSDAATWSERRRPEILKLFEDHVYGIAPPPAKVQATLVSTTNQAFGGKAIRREIDITIGEGESAQTIALLVYSPASATLPAACFLGLNFHGNHTVESDTAIRLPTSWVRAKNDGTSDGNRANEAGRGTGASSWPAEQIVERGYALATVYYGDIDPDFDDGFQNGIHATFHDWAETVEANKRWGSIAAWAYGLSRVLDYLQSDPMIDADRVAVIGHSRLGKTSLWAGATDERFKLVISNNSGCGGAALNRRAFGETVERINQSFPHWFNDQFNQYNQNESELPVDQHQLIALVAPRPVYVASATEDPWADPKGEFLSCVHADPVYRLLGTAGMGGKAPPTEMPAAEMPIQTGVIGYHLRSGNHGLTGYDWQQYMNFADKHL